MKYTSNITVNNPLMRMGVASLLAASLSLSLGACGQKASAEANLTETVSQEASAETDGSALVSTANMTTDGALDTTDLFTERDLTQTVDLAGATAYTVSTGQSIQITEEGTYVISGEATNATIYVDAQDSDKVQIVLAGANITNENFPVIYVRSADKVFVTTLEGSTNTLQVTGTFEADGDTNTDAVIFSKDDLTLNGLGTLVINSTANGITCKDDLKVTGGTYNVTAAADTFEANDSIRISDGNFTVTASKDGFHAENSDDNTLGYIYLCGGTYTINATDDGIQATTVLQIDDGTYAINAGEGLEATYVQVNNGNVQIEASDDGINASSKSTFIATPTIDIRGGELTIDMGSGDTDALDANGDLLISGGTVNINAQFAFDFDGNGSLTGGTVYVNGEQVSEIESSMMMGGGPGGMGGHGFPGDMGGQGGPGNMSNQDWSSSSVDAETYVS